jgi:protein ImuB
MLWLALYCPTLALDCLLRRWPDGLEPALAVIDVDGTKRFIAATTRTAQACGVFAGQSVATALALLPDLLVVARKLEDERRALTEAALAALRFTPTVSLRASGLVMEVSASLRLFGGRRALKRGIGHAMRQQGLRIAAAEAPTPHGAWLLAKEKARRQFQAVIDAERSANRSSRGPANPRAARKPGDRDAPVSPTPPDRSAQRPPAGPEPVGESAPSPFDAAAFDARLNALPIAHLESLGPAIRRMDGIGLYTLADLRRLPVKGLARRFGEGVIDELARATGDRPDPQIVFEAPSRFDARIELMARVENAEALVFACQRLLAQMAGWLTARRAAVRGFTLVLHHERWTRAEIHGVHDTTPVVIALASPSSDLARLVTLIRERLSRLELKAPVLELSIEAPTIVEEREAPGTLFPEREEAAETLARLLEKLIARLGHEAMARIERVADHRPERAWREVHGDLLEERIAQAARSPPSRRPRGRSSNGHGPIEAIPDIGLAHRPITPGCSSGPRPAWLLAEPKQLEVRADRPMFESLPLSLLAGPERIETGWWDDAPATRDYFIAENASGHLVWIYKQRLVEAGKPVWYLQGLFG